MFGYFGHSLLRKYTIVFGTLFNQIYVERQDNNGTRQKTLHVPLAYGPKEKFILREAEDPDLDRPIAQSLPRLGFERTAMFYDPERSLNSIHRNVKIDATNTDNIKTQFVPRPYNLNYSLYAMVHYAEDGDQIAEQILPYFTPDWTVNMELIPEMNISKDIPIVLESVSLDDTYEGDFQTRRAMIWTFNFIMKAWLYGPVKDGGLITKVDTNLYVPEYLNDIADTPVLEKLSITPGQLANGSPTSNASLTVPRDQIASNSTYDYIETLTVYDDGVGG